MSELLDRPARIPTASDEVHQRGVERSVRRSRITSGLVVTVFAILAVGWLVPIVSAMVLSLRTYDDLLLNGFLAWPESLSFANYVTAWERGGGQFMRSSFIITLPSLFFLLLLASMAAFALSRFRIRGAKTILLVMLGANMLPPQILLVPYFRLAEALGIYNTYAAVVFAHVGFGLGFYTFVLYNFMRQLPDELFDAARVDGATSMQMYTRIITPLMRPAFAALGTLGFTWIYNDLLWALALLRDSDKLPSTAGILTLQGQFTTDYTLVSAAAIIAALPTMIVFIALQRHFVRGLLLGRH